MRVDQWRYKTVHCPFDVVDERLNEWGRDGWELVQMVISRSGMGYDAVFKRPIHISTDSKASAF